MSHKQMTLAVQSDAGFEQHRKATRRDVFLAEMDKVVPWSALCAAIEPFYPKERAEGGRRPIGLERMLRIHFLQQWYALSDPAMEEALYEIAPLRQFAGLSLLDAIPDETTLLNFRHLLERHGLAAQMLTAVNADLSRRGLLLRQGTMVDATIIHAPSSTKNSSGARDPEMHQTRKGNQWFFGLKAHIGVDRDSGLVHTVVTTAANVHDVTQTHALLHGKEKTVFADAGYTGADKREELKGKRIDWHIAERRHKVKALPEGELKDVTLWLEHLRAKVRARVEHPFRVIKQQFGFQKTRYRGLAKNGAQLNTLFALSNLWMVRRRMLSSMGEMRP